MPHVTLTTVNINEFGKAETAAHDEEWQSRIVASQENRERLSGFWICVHGHGPTERSRPPTVIRSDGGMLFIVAGLIAPVAQRFLCLA